MSLQSLTLTTGFLMFGCSSSDGLTPVVLAHGGALTTGATSNTGSGGAGGEVANSGGRVTGGSGTGVSPIGGSKATGGSKAAGGNAAGGSKATGGSKAAGGNAAGGSKATGGNALGGNATGGKAVGGSATGGKAAGGTSAAVVATGGNSSNNGGVATVTIPGNGCTPPSAYANLFVSVSGKTQADTEIKINAAWTQLFTPSGSNTVYYNGPGSDESYVMDTGNNDVRTEGMSYGMMTAVQLNHQTEFDRLWTFTKKHMVKGTGSISEITWSVSTSGGSNGKTGGAPDGDEYFAQALIFAHNRWGDTGKYNYATEAQLVLDLLRTKDFSASAHIVQFYAGSGNTDASYILPAFYQTWACFDTANKAFWDSAVTAGRALFKAAADASTGVIGDHQSFTGQTQQGAGSDAKRCVMNIMMDYNFFAADPWQKDTYAPNFSKYMSSHSDGSAAQFSCNALLGFGLPASSGKAFVDKLWSAAIPTGTYRYYDGTLYMLALLHVSGTFKLWY